MNGYQQSRLFTPDNSDPSLSETPKSQRWGGPNVPRQQQPWQAPYINPGPVSSYPGNSAFGFSQGQGGGLVNRPAFQSGYAGLPQPVPWKAPEARLPQDNPNVLRNPFGMRTQEGIW
jgi:hypothetical protein